MTFQPCCCCDTECTDVFDAGVSGDLKLIVAGMGAPYDGTWTLIRDDGPFGPDGCAWWYNRFRIAVVGGCTQDGAWRFYVTQAGYPVVWTLTVELWYIYSGAGCPDTGIATSWTTTYDCTMPREAIDIGNMDNPLGPPAPATVNVGPP